MRRPYRLFFLGLVLLVGTGCGKTSPTPPDPHAGHQIEMGQAGATPQAQSRIVFENDPKNWSKPGPNTFIFRILGKDGADLKDSDLKIVHEKRVHLLLVRDDMTQFQHLHPTYELADGNYRWIAPVLIPEGGDYHLYLDVAPEKEDPTVLHTSFRMGTPTREKMFPVPTEDNAVMTEGIRAALATPSPLTTGGSTRLTFTLTENGQLVKNIDPYLGAFGHVVILRHNAPEDFLHVHPVTQTKPTDGTVEFETTFKTKGRYTLYAQFNVNGSVKTFPITIDVGEGAMNAMEGTNMPVMMDHSQH